MQEQKTHFEQIPVETVKKIAYELPAHDEIEDHTPDGGVSTHENWRELAQKIQVEPNPDKMIELVQQLIETYDYDEEKLRCARRRTAGPK